MLAEALDPSAIEQRLQALGIWCQAVASGEKREAMDAYLTVNRSIEEICLLKEEAENMVIYYRERKGSLEKAVEHYSDTNSL